MREKIFEFIGNATNATKVVGVTAVIVGVMAASTYGAYGDHPGPHLWPLIDTVSTRVIEYGPDFVTTQWPYAFSPEMVAEKTLIDVKDLLTYIQPPEQFDPEIVVGILPYSLSPKMIVERTLTEVIDLVTDDGLPDDDTCEDISNIAELFSSIKSVAKIVVKRMETDQQRKKGADTVFKMIENLEDACNVVATLQDNNGTTVVSFKNRDSILESRFKSPVVQLSKAINRFDSTLWSLAIEHLRERDD